jgi:DNA replication protein DnaC
MVGPHSSGKTTLASLILNELSRRNYSVYFVAFADYIGWLLRQMSVQKQADKLEPRALETFWAIEDRKERLYTSDFVVLDDVGKEHRTHSKFAEDELDKLLRARHRNGLPTGSTTNLALNKWGTVYDPSMEGFVMEAFEEIGLGGKNLRDRRN